LAGEAINYVQGARYFLYTTNPESGASKKIIDTKNLSGKIYLL
jgi:hypothetical protein